MRRFAPTALAATLAGVLLAVVAPAGDAGAPAPPAQVRVDFYFEPGCSECGQVRQDVLPRLRADLPDAIDLREWDLGGDAAKARLAAEMDRLGETRNAHVYMVIGGTRMLAGFDEIDARAVAEAGDQFSAALAAPPPAVPEPSAPAAGGALWIGRLSRFTALGVAAAGFLDGINPCAIATLVFLISVLSLSRVSGRRLALVGAVFCAASFLTYAAIGFGLLQALHALAFFPSVQRAVDTALTLVLVVLAALSFADAWRFARSGTADDVTLQLPDRIKALTHRLMRRQLGGGAQLASVFVVGAAVTGLESVCTGQVYLPTLVMVVKTGQSVARGLLYLGLYNLMFILPLVIVIALMAMVRGLRVFDLVRWSKRNVVVSKVLLGLFFAVLACVMVLMR